ncbi:zinc finger protein 615-like [Oppia nitens]|uniref:zinc finger protein 615-like n=1 Tax=Oppia nitens TaxID=1686743 RepID=UPI0023DA956B|nr:zinc finger protein 615-like [Oppia nitens]
MMSDTCDDSNRLLGMLAEVAVKTLNAEQQLNQRMYSKSDKAYNQISTTVLNVDQIVGHSDKIFVESNSELSCDSNRHIFKLKCRLIPNKCDFILHTTQADDRVYTLMKNHILDHINGIESNFTAESFDSTNQRLNDGKRLYSTNSHSKIDNILRSDLQTNKSIKSKTLMSETSVESVKTHLNNELTYKPMFVLKQNCDDLNINLITSHNSDEDHCYTSLDGPKHINLIPIETFNENVLTKKKKCLNSTKVITTPAFPFIYEPILPNISQVIEIGSNNNNIVNSKMCLNEPELSQTIDDNVVDALNTNALQLKRLALQYINDIRVKNRGQTDKSPFRCKICIDKTFTSPTTLIYHYRSHAGVKPFQCSLCKSTFTRQHSLNYHMLIHLNKSRFVCEECGRNFRHPSHFKEHMRRHTGETPYECNDCFIKFKTRNTYKRHLQTKHSKMLTSKGIFDLPDANHHIRKPCPPRRKYGLGFLHQNIEAVARYERAQEEVNQSIKDKCHLIDTIDSNHILINKFNSSKNNFEKLLQAVAIAEDINRPIIT